MERERDREREGERDSKRVIGYDMIECSII